jgi:hypothetical protein
VQLKIPFARINPDETLGDAFRVSREELGMTGSSDWARHGFGDYIETFSYEILHVLEKSISRTEWRKGWERLGRPKDEEILLDTIMAMQLRNFLLFFGSMKPTSEPRSFAHDICSVSYRQKANKGIDSRSLYSAIGHSDPSGNWRICHGIRWQATLEHALATS